MSSKQVDSAVLLSTSGFEWRRWGFQIDFRQEELEAAREVSGLTFSSAPTSCTSPSSCSLSLWIQSRRGSRGRGEGGWEEGFGWCTRRVGAQPWVDRRWKFPLYVWALFGMGGVWSWSWSWKWGEWLGWGLGTWQWASHSRKLASFTRTKEAVLDTAVLSERSTPVITLKKTGSQKCGLHGWWPGLTAVTHSCTQHLGFLTECWQSENHQEKMQFPFFLSTESLLFNNVWFFRYHGFTSLRLTSAYKEVAAEDLVCVHISQMSRVALFTWKMFQHPQLLNLDRQSIRSYSKYTSQ